MGQSLISSKQVYWITSRGILRWTNDSQGHLLRRVIFYREAGDELHELLVGRRLRLLRKRPASLFHLFELPGLRYAYRYEFFRSCPLLTPSMKLHLRDPCPMLQSELR